MRYLHTFLFFFVVSIPAMAQPSWHVSLLCNWNDTADIRDNGFGQRYNDVWGFVWNGKEYAALGSTEGVHIIDIDQCQQVAFYAGRANGNNISHRDFKTYQHYLYAVCGEGISSLQVFDLNYLPDSLHLVYESDPNELALANAIFIDTAKATLYVCTPRGFSTGEDYMRVYSLDSPEHPSLLVNYNDFAQVHTVFVRNDTAYCASSYYGLVVVDFSDHGTYHPFAALTNYPYKGYCHSSWVDGNNMAVMSDETFGSPVKVVDMQHLPQVNTRGMFSPRPGDSTCIPHNPYKLGAFALISYYQDGLQIYDVSLPDNPVRVGYYQTFTGSNFQGYAGAWGCYPYLPSKRILVSDMQHGLFVLDADSALNGAALGVPAVETGAWTFYPNPAKDKLYMEQRGSGVDGAADIIIYDMMGREMMKESIFAGHKTNQAIELTLPGYWPGGVYTIRVQAGNYLYTGKFTKS